MGLRSSWIQVKLQKAMTCSSNCSLSGKAGVIKHLKNAAQPCSCLSVSLQKGCASEGETGDAAQKADACNVHEIRTGNGPPYLRHQAHPALQALCGRLQLLRCTRAGRSAPVRVQSTVGRFRRQQEEGSAGREQNNS